MAKKRFYEGEYAGSQNSKAMQERDSMMIGNDYNAVANLPQEVKYHAWPKARHYAQYDLDDTISGVDKQMNEDGADMKRHKSKSKY